MSLYMFSRGKTVDYLTVHQPLNKINKSKEAEALSEIDTEGVERMVHVMPIMTVVREDKVIKNFTRDELQQSAPETTDGYWQVPRLVE